MCAILPERRKINFKFIWNHHDHCLYFIRPERLFPKPWGRNHPTEAWVGSTQHALCVGLHEAFEIGPWSSSASGAVPLPAALELILLPQ